MSQNEFRPTAIEFTFWEQKNCETKTRPVLNRSQDSSSKLLLQKRYNRSVVSIAIFISNLVRFHTKETNIWELRDQMPSAWTTMILVQSSTALGDTQDTVVISHENDIEQIILWITISWGTSRIRTHDLVIVGRTRCHLSYRDSVKLGVVYAEFKLVLFTIQVWVTLHLFGEEYFLFFLYVGVL